MDRGRRGFGLRFAQVAALALLTVWPTLAAQPAFAGNVDEVGLTYTYGEVVQDDEGVFAVDPTASFGLELSRRLRPAEGGRPALACDLFGTLGRGSPRRAGLNLNLEWPPAEGSSTGRRYSLSASLANRWPTGGQQRAEESWGATATVHDPGLGPANLEAGGRAAAHLNRLSGRDYWETGGYLATRFGVDGEPALFSWLDPDWLGGFGALLTPPPEPGSEERLDLPAWYERAALDGLPGLPAIEAAAAAPLARLTVITRHTQTARTYAGDPSANWEAGVTRLEARERHGRYEVAATYSHTLKLYPADGSRTYELSEGELEVAHALRSGRVRAAASFRSRRPWDDGGEAYRQAGLRLRWEQPAQALTWRFTADWHGRWYSAGSGDDYTLAEVEGGLSRSAGGPGGPSASLTVALSRRGVPEGGAPDEYRLRLRLSGELHPAPGRTLSAGLAWERPTTVAAGGSGLVPGPTETLLRLSWKRTF